MAAKSEIHVVSPRPDVEIHLPDGRVLSGPRNSPVGDFLRTLEFPVPIVAAAVDGELRELTYPIGMDASVRPISMSESDGALIYRRSLNFLLEMTFADLFPNATVRIDHSISFGGYYCEVDGRGPLSEDELARLKSHMKELVAADMRFERNEVPLQQAIDYFKSVGYEDKVRLLKYRRKPYLTLYRLGDRMDYHHGYMVPSTGYLQWFDLFLVNGGFTLRFPRRHAPTELEPITHYPQLLAAFRAGRSPINLVRTRSRTVITTYGSDFATVSTLSRRPQSGKVGRTMQTWVRFPQGWRIVAAHVSTIDAPSNP